jgi:hypothetical protein
MLQVKELSRMEKVKFHLSFVDFLILHAFLTDILCLLTFIAV